MAFTDENTINLEECGAPELWFTYKRPGMLAYKEQIEYMRRHPKYKSDISSQLNSQTLEDILNDADEGFKHSLSLVTAWNLTSKVTNEICAIPSIDDSWQDIITMYITYVVTNINSDPTVNFLEKLAEQKVTSQTPTEKNGNGNSMLTVKP
jgi:hypothetical protein